MKRKKSKSRSSDSRLPVPSHPISALPDMDVRQIEFEEQLSKVGKRKPTRRQSGLLTSVSITTVTPSGFSTELVPPRPPSPAFGSPIRREVGLAEEADERRAINGNDDEEDEVEVILQSTAKREKKEKERKKERIVEKDRDKDKDRQSSSSSSERTKERERKRARDPDTPAPAPEGSKSKLKDVTNSHPTYPVLLEIDDGEPHRALFDGAFVHSTLMFILLIFDDLRRSGAPANRRRRCTVS